VCRSAGYWAAPYPVAERLALPRDLDADALAVVAGPRPAVLGAGLDLRWATVDLAGRRGSATVGAPEVAGRHGAFVTPVEVQDLSAQGGAANSLDLALALVLPSWTLLGMLDRAVADTRAQITVRHQFGQPLAQFQGVQFQLTDAEVERAGVEVLAKYALWSVQSGRPDVVADALALRLAAVEAAEIVFRVAHQLHGATGFCDETPLSWLSRYSQPLRRLPLGPAATRDALTARVGRAGLAGIFGPAVVQAS
jgi:alkylation response protein AidB-like acyl-CoA dehydrogenase